MTAEELRERVNRMDKRFEEAMSLLNKIFTDVTVIKNTCETRGVMCSEHFANVEKKLIKVEDEIDGGTNHSGIKIRIDRLEKKNSNKENLFSGIIGALSAAFFGVLVFLIQKLLSS